MATSDDQTEIIHDFLLTTTAHGYYKLAVLRGRRLFRYLWSAILVFFVIGFTIHLGSLLLNFFSYPLTTEIGFNEVPYRNPDFTVCGRSPISLIRSGRALPVPYPPGSNLSWALISAYEFWKGLLPKRASVHGKLAMQSIKPMIREVDAWHQLEELFITCRSDGQNCSMATNITSWLHPTQGRCWTLSPKHGEPTDFRQTALQIFAFNENANWSPEVGLLPPEAHRGEIFLMPHPNGHFPKIHGPSTLEAGEGVSTAERVLMTRTFLPERHPVMRCKPAHHLADLEVRLWPFRKTKKFKYTPHLCRQLAFASVVSERCRCLDTTLAVPEDTNPVLPSCFDIREILLRQQSPEAVTNASKTCNKSSGSQQSFICSLVANAWERASCLHDLNKAFANGSLTFESCSTPCSYDSYSSSSSINVLITRNWYSQLSQIVREKLKTNPKLVGLKKWLQESSRMNACCISQVHVTAESLWSDRLEEKDSYSLANLVSDVGGTLGLWVGCSVITIFEMIELPVRLSLMKIKKLS